MKRFPVLDGLRGASALYVVLHHAHEEVRVLAPDAWLVRRCGWLEYGHFAVAVFIVLSGFSLAIGDTFRGGFWKYLGRRARRILPPYYAALALSLLAIRLVPALHHHGDPRWAPVALPAMSTGPIVSHLLLIHNFQPAWACRIDPPMWSVATEWQVYFLLPALLWAWRRWGASGAVTLGFAVGLAPLLLVPRGHECVGCFWYAGLFAFGVAAARGPGTASCPRVVMAAVPVALLMSNGVAVLDAFVGAITAGFLTRTIQSGDKTLVVRALESRPAVTLGGFSYSLYLTHYPVQAALTAALVRLGVPPSARLALLLTAGTALCLAVSYAFHLAFERPFLLSHARSGSPRSGDGTSDRQAPAGGLRHHRHDPDHRDPTRPATHVGLGR
jgi:peptidoglycan/LPS O-acetylase OafA/YrhL